MKLGLLHRGEYPEAIRLELEQIIASITTAFYREHDAEGDHVRITGRWTLGANQSVPDSVNTVIQAVVPDATNAGDLTLAAPGIVRVSTPGLYLCIGQIRWAAGAGGLRAVGLLHQRALCAYALGYVSAANSWVQAVECRTCEKGDTLEMFGNQTSGGAFNAEMTGGQTFFRVTRVGG